MLTSSLIHLYPKPFLCTAWILITILCINGVSLQGMIIRALNNNSLLEVCVALLFSWFLISGNNLENHQTALCCWDMLPSSLRAVLQGLELLKITDQWVFRTARNSSELLETARNCSELL